MGTDTSSVVQICLTGGPGGGKSTSIAKVRQRLGQLGFRVVVIPEVVTDMVLSGVGPGEPWEDPVQFQLAALRRQLFMEQEARDALNVLGRSDNKPGVVISDRGLLDFRAYVTKTQERSILTALGMSAAELGGVYKGVIHLVTAAEGAVQHYTLANNVARHESPAQACALDRRTRKAWLGIQKLVVVDNTTDFDGKLERVHQSIAEILGIPVPIEAERKFLVQPPNLHHLRPFVQVRVRQEYLQTASPQVEERIRIWEYAGGRLFFHTIKEQFPGAFGAYRRFERERQIDERTYLGLMTRADPEARPVVKTRYCFLWKGQYCMLDEFHAPKRGLWLLEIELTKAQPEMQVPPALRVLREVTDDPDFTNAVIARSA